jgi:hypothetical protein
MAKNKKSALIGSLGGAGGGLVLIGLIHDFVSQTALTIEWFLTYEILGIILIILGTLVHYKF